MRTQKEIISKVAEVAGEKLAEKNVHVTNELVKTIVDAYIAETKEDLMTTGKAKIADLGTLEIRYRAQREGRNPRTKETIIIPETIVPGYSASAPLKREVLEKCEIANYRK